MNIDRHVFVAEWPQVTGPGVGMAIAISLLAKVAGYIAIHGWLLQRDALREDESSDGRPLEPM